MRMPFSRPGGGGHTVITTPANDCDEYIGQKAPQYTGWRSTQTTKEVPFVGGRMAYIRS